MEKAEPTLTTKLKQLERAQVKANEVLKGGKGSAVERQLSNLKELVTEVYKVRRTVEG